MIRLWSVVPVRDMTHTWKHTEQACGWQDVEIHRQEILNKNPIHVDSTGTKKTQGRARERERVRERGREVARDIARET